MRNRRADQVKMPVAVNSRWARTTLQGACEEHAILAMTTFTGGQASCTLLGGGRGRGRGGKGQTEQWVTEYLPHKYLQSDVVATLAPSESHVVSHSFTTEVPTVTVGELRARRPTTHAAVEPGTKLLPRRRRESRNSCCKPPLSTLLADGAKMQVGTREIHQKETEGWQLPPLRRCSHANMARHLASLSREG